jgi:hypothetical protein
VFKISRTLLKQNLKKIDPIKLKKLITCVVDSSEKTGVKCVFFLQFFEISRTGGGGRPQNFSNRTKILCNDVRDFKNSQKFRRQAGMVDLKISKSNRTKILCYNV